MSKNVYSRLLLGATVWLLSMGVAFGYLTDASVHPPAVYSGLATGPGGTYADPVFGTHVKRLSDAINTPSAVGGNLRFVMTEYSTMSPFNQNNSRLILQHDSYYGLYDGNGNFIRNLPLEVHAASEPRWSRHEANALYFVNGNQLRKLNVDSGAISVVRAFGEYGSIGGRGESDISADGDHFVFVGDNRDIFVYQISTNAKGGVLNTGGRGFDSIYITPNNNVTVTWLSAGRGRYQGIELFDRNMQYQRQVAPAGGHMDVARDVNGDEVLLWANAADPAPQCDNAVVKIRLADAHQTCLVSVDWSLALNVSAADNNGWVYVATYAPGDPLPGGGWPAMTNEILQVRLDGGEVRRLAHHRSRPFNGYNWTPRPSVSRDGSKLVFGSNFGMQEIGYPTEYNDAYLINVPGAGSGGAGGGGGGTPPPPPPPPADGGGDGGAPVPPPPPPPGDGGGGSIPGATTRVEEDGAGVSFTGNWYANGTGGHSAGTARLSMDAGSAVTFNFNGVGARWIAYRDEWAGIAEIWLDGNFFDSVDTYASPAASQNVVYAIDGLADGNHTLRIVVAGRHNGASGGSWVWVDAFEAVAGGVAPPPPPTTPPAGGGGDGGGGSSGTNVVRIEESDGTVSYTPGWFHNGNGGHSGGSAILAMDAGQRVTLQFTGNGVSWIAYRDEWAGIARVYLDGQLVDEVDTYAAPGAAQQQVYKVTGLPYGAHTLVIEATQRQNPSSGGAWVWVDAFEVIR